MSAVAASHGDQPQAHLAIASGMLVQGLGPIKHGTAIAAAQSRAMASLAVMRPLQEKIKPSSCSVLNPHNPSNFAISAKSAKDVI